VRKKTVRRAEPDSTTVREPQPWEFELAHDLPGVPVLPQTLLRLELEAQERCVDLRGMSEVVLSDLGATVQILRLSALECDTDRRLTRIEDCISDLGLSACLEAVSTQPVARDDRYNSIAETWAHSREIALYARLAAEDTPDVNPDEAYLVGLLHTIGLLPHVLGWGGSASSSIDPAYAGFQMARRWSLPQFAVEYFREIYADGSATPWPEIVHKAHRSASNSSYRCPLEHRNRPQLYRAV
jgi:HDOD domain